jgi:hypothetical protein
VALVSSVAEITSRAVRASRSRYRPGARRG